MLKSVKVTIGAASFWLAAFRTCFSIKPTGCLPSSLGLPAVALRLTPGAFAHQ
jgi:hypothetical protein